MKDGTTTRKVDRWVQEFFINGVTYVFEGRDSDRSKHHHAMGVFQRRMELEHPSSKYTYEYKNWEGTWCYKVEAHNL